MVIINICILVKVASALEGLICEFGSKLGLKKKLFVSVNGIKKNIIFLVKNVCFMHALN